MSSNHPNVPHGLSECGIASTLPSATSRCAVDAVFCPTATRGVHPFDSCAARNAAITANSNFPIPSGQLTTGSSLSG